MKDERQQVRRCVTRRELVRAGLGIAGLGAIGAVMGPLSAFAANGGGGGGGQEGTGDGDAAENGFNFIWFDRGGSDALAPAQGWGQASIDYFVGLIERQRGRQVSRRPLDEPTWNGRSAYEVVVNVCNEAIANACARSGEDKARIVGVGYWWYKRVDGTLGWASSSINYRGFETLITRRANASECTTDSGWDNVIDQTTHNDALQNEIWRDYIYRIGKVDNPGTHYSFVAVAVADNEPPMTGMATLEKKSQAGDWL